MKSKDMYVIQQNIHPERNAWQTISLLSHPTHFATLSEAKKAMESIPISTDAPKLRIAKAYTVTKYKAVKF